MAEISIKERLLYTHADYDANIDSWTLYGEAVSGNGGFKDGSNVTKFVKESTDKYDRRKLAAYYLNHSAPVIDTYVGHLYKKPIVRQYNDNKELARFYESTNITGDQTIDELMQLASVTALTYGMAYVVIDRTKADADEIITKKDEIDKDVKTYAYVINPKQLIDWAIGDDGLFEWVKIKETYTTGKESWFADHIEKTRYRIWTRTEWMVYEQGESVPSSQDTHDLGFVPVIPVYNIQGEGGTIIGRSEISEIAKINKTIFNNCSELDDLMINNAFSLLAMEKDNASKEGFELGSDRVLFYKGDKLPEYISPPPQAIEAYEKRIKTLVDEIYRIAKINYNDGIALSGIALAFKFEKTNQNLARKAGNLEDAELKIANTVLAWSSDDNANKNVDVTIIYPADFGIIDLAGEADKDQKVLDLGLGEVAEKTYKKQIAPKYIKGTLEEMSDIDADIDSMEVPTDFSPTRNQKSH
jgi:hypothetical protein